MQAIQKTDIRSLSPDKLKEHFISISEPAFRAKQVYEWLWEKSCTDFEEMSNLSKPLREKLKETFTINNVQVHQSQFSSDKTIKSTFMLFDNNIIEGVLIPATDRMTACVSSQVGCSLTCKFCATGYMDRKRNLNADEIYDQVVLIDKQAKENYQIPLSNIVYMGMGEPLLNYANVLKSIERITAKDGLNMASKRITVSTAGIAKMIKKLGDDEVKFNLALSLHAANDEKRNTIMPINEQNSLKALADALKRNVIAGAGLDVFEHEPKVHEGLLGLDNAVLIPHLGSATVETRTAMANTAATNSLAVLAGKTAPNLVG